MEKILDVPISIIYDKSIKRFFLRKELISLLYHDLFCYFKQNRTAFIKLFETVLKVDDKHNDLSETEIQLFARDMFNELDEKLLKKCISKEMFSGFYKGFSINTDDETIVPVMHEELNIFDITEKIKNNDFEEEENDVNSQEMNKE